MTCENFSTATSSAPSQLIASGAEPRVARCIGCSSRVCIVTAALAVRCSVEPLVHRRPKLAGCSGSPRTPVICAPSDSMITPQPTPQYGQVERVCFMARDTSDFDRALGAGDRPREIGRVRFELLRIQVHH